MPSTAHPSTHDQPAYPVRVTLRDGQVVLIREISPGDAEREQAFVRGLSQESRYFRFMNTLRELPPEMLDRFTHPDPCREVALVALAGEGTEASQVAVARFMATPDGQAAEFAIVVADAWQGRGLGSALMRQLITTARARGLQRLEGWVLSSNHRMLELMASLGFEVRIAADDARMRRVVLALRS